jgi:hypothetical protein
MRWVGWAAVAGLLVAAFVAPGVATSTDAPGNNGTVKIHEGATEEEPIVANDPHVCTFHLHFFFADPFQAGTWEIQEWSPGDKGVVVLSGTYDTNGDGEDRDPDAGVYTLPDGHYKLFWDGDLDTEKHDKHKVFWVDCLETAPPSFEQSQTPETEAPSAPPSFEQSQAPETESPAPSFEQSQVPETEAPSFEQSQVPETEAPSFEQSQVPETESPAPSFEQSQGAETESPAPSVSFGQTQGAETDVPGQRTQPPTDTAVTSAPNDDGWRWLFVIIASLLGAVLVMTPKVRMASTNR